MSGDFFFFFFSHVRLITTPCQVFNNCAMSGDFLPCKANYCTMSGLTIAPCQAFFFFFFHVRLITTPCQVCNNCAMSGDFLLFKANYCTMSGLIILQLRHVRRFFFFFFLLLFFFHVRLITTLCQVFNNCTMSGDVLPCKANNCTMSGLTIVSCRRFFFFFLLFFFFFFFSCKAYYLTMFGV